MMNMRSENLISPAILAKEHTFGHEFERIIFLLPKKTNFLPDFHSQIRIFPAFGEKERLSPAASNPAVASGCTAGPAERG